MKKCLQRILSLSLITPLLIGLSFHSLAQVFPSGFSRVLVANGMSNPTVMTFAPDGRIFVAQQNGVLRVIKNNTLLATPFISLSVNSSGERGLIGIALDPNFATNQFIYLYYTLPDGSRNRISRFTGNGDVVVPGSEVVLLNLDPLSSATNHNGGAMHFKDGLLYVAIGENANGAHAQNLDTYHGKLLRIHSNGSIPAGNPFTTGSEQRRRVWAYGLRNPFTFDIQPGTGKIFVNDVGQGSWEEIDDATNGGLNFGWPTAEGNSTNPSFTNPVYAYQHGSGDGRGCAITGGVFFNPSSSNYPSQYTGRYFYMDLCNAWINMLDLTTTPATRLPFATNVGGNILSLDVGNDGNLYYLDRNNNGALYKVIYTINNAPAIVNHPQSITVTQGQPASFSVTATGTAPLQYQWQKNNVNITGANSSTYTIMSAQPSDAAGYRVLVSNSAGSATSNIAQLGVTAFNAPPVAQINTPAQGALYRGGDVISFSGDATDPEDGTLPASAFTWSVVFHHDTHTHDGPPIASGVKAGSFTIPNTGETDDDVFYRLYLVVKDSKGLADTVFRDVLPRKSTMTFATQPAGLQVTLDGQPMNTPLSVVGVESIQRTIGVVEPQISGGNTYVFDRWLHGGSATQIISTPINDVTYTAVFRTALRAPENPPNTSNGLTYSYYEGTWTSLPDFATITPAESGNISSVNLWPKNRDDYYAFRWTGFIDVPADGNWTFYTMSDEGSQLLIGNTVVVNNNGIHTAQEASGTIGLLRGKHAFTVTYFEHLGAASIITRWAGPGVGKRVIPNTAFYRTLPAGSSPIAREDERDGVSVYPNPAFREISVAVEVPENENMVSVTLVNLMGKDVLLETFREIYPGENILALNIEGLPDGIYQLRVRSSSSLKTKTVVIRK